LKLCPGDSERKCVSQGRERRLNSRATEVSQKVGKVTGGEGVSEDGGRTASRGALSLTIKPKRIDKPYGESRSHEARTQVYLEKKFRESRKQGLSLGSVAFGMRNFL